MLIESSHTCSNQHDMRAQQSGADGDGVANQAVASRVFNRKSEKGYLCDKYGLVLVS